ncbi:mini-chromosome maintenance complex-binding protein [Impatiens glandulifera]|uniref:mini-chromosome maintenance complex-binding protein n=1 Tax=Impatiens glandulifera TaxID=253017 RepID=UPI001FB0B111|nr:mini-chromosome maintenance complex-binding protein [Impatiens glandulifera]
MVGPLYDLIANPLGAIRLTFEKAVAAGSDPGTFTGKDWGVCDLFREFLFEDGNISQVPVLNSTNIQWIKPNTLVKFRGMVQDMLGNEFYIGIQKDEGGWRTNKFTDSTQFPVSSSETPPWERHLLYCIPVPGLNPWAEVCSNSHKQCTNLTSPQREKRQREDNADFEAMDVQVLELNDDDFPTTKKMREDGPLSSHPEGSSPSSKIDSERNSLPCLVKVYDSAECDLKLNDVFEFVGVLTFDSEPPVEEGNNDELMGIFCDDASGHLPPSKVPRLHCLAHRKLAVQDFLTFSVAEEPKPQLVKEIRAALLDHLTAILGNDGVAAHFMLLHLLSMVHSRVDSLAVGKFSLNLTSFSKESASVFCNHLNFTLRNLLPYTQSMSLTVDYLNTVSLTPKKDYEINRLRVGDLQLAEGTHMTIDETKLEPGMLNPSGVDNARLLKNLMEFQNVEYDFEFYKMEMKADVQLLIISEGKSNILPADTVLPFRPTCLSSYKNIDGENINLWRWYLTSLRSLPYSIDSAMQKTLEDELVAARQADRTIGSLEFSRWLTMGRLMSISYGETSLSHEHWQMVKELESLRRERL